MRIWHQPSGRKSGYVLIEYLIYIALLAVVMEVAFSGFYRFLENSRGLARNSDDIVRSLRAGELWRSDIRLATGPPRMVQESGVTACEIPQRQGRVDYVLVDHSVWRREGNRAPQEVLARVKEVRFLRDPREAVVAWRWEVELLPKKNIVRIRPLFTFEAVPARQGL
jgi:hypothetical protein